MRRDETRRDETRRDETRSLDQLGRTSPPTETFYRIEFHDSALQVLSPLSVSATLSSLGNFSILLTALNKTGLDLDALFTGASAMTVFAPNDAAFGAYLKVRHRAIRRAFSIDLCIHPSILALTHCCISLPLFTPPRLPTSPPRSSWTTLACPTS